MSTLLMILSDSNHPDHTYLLILICAVAFVAGDEASDFKFDVYDDHGHW